MKDRKQGEQIKKYINIFEEEKTEVVDQTLLMQNPTASHICGLLTGLL